MRVPKNPGWERRTSEDKQRGLEWKLKPQLHPRPCTPYTLGTFQPTRLQVLMKESGYFFPPVFADASVHVGTNPPCSLLSPNGQVDMHLSRIHSRLMDSIKADSTPFRAELALSPPPCPQPHTHSMYLVHTGASALCRFLPTSPSFYRTRKNCSNSTGNSLMR